MFTNIKIPQSTIKCFCRTQFQQVHMVDALTLKDEEGRCRVRKVPERSQATIDPEISEWGNPRADEARIFH